MRSSINRDEIFKFIQKNGLAVLSYVCDENLPHSALVEYSEKDDFSIIFDTFQDARKYESILRKPRVSLVLGFNGEQSVQYEGVAREVLENELEEVKKIHRRKLYDVEKFEDNPRISYFLIQPSRVKYTDVSIDPWIVEEISF